VDNFVSDLMTRTLLASRRDSYEGANSMNGDLRPSRITHTTRETLITLLGVGASNLLPERIATKANKNERGEEASGV